MNHRWIKLGAVMLIVVLLAGLAVLLMRPKEDLFPPLLSPNGYDDFIAAAQFLPAYPREYTSLPTDQQRAFVESALPGLTQSLAGFERECVVPVQFTETWIVQTHLNNIGSIKELTRCYTAAGKLAAEDGDLDQALTWNLRATELGHKSPRGGLLIDSLVGLSCQAMSHKGLNEIVTQLNLSQSRELAQKLEHLEANREDWDAIFKRDKDWAKCSRGIQYIIGCVSWLVGSGQT